jgi:hypothetical protein
MQPAIPELDRTMTPLPGVNISRKADSRKCQTATVTPAEPGFSQDNKSYVAALSPIPFGLTTIGIRTPLVLPYSRSTLTKLAIENSNKLDIPMPNANWVLSLYSGNHRRLEQAKALDAANLPSKSTAQHDYQICGSRDGFDWLSDEGLSVLLPIVNGDVDWVTLEQEIAGPVTPTMTSGMCRIDTAAKQSKNWVMLFFVCPDGYETSRIHEMCTEYIEVALCEPDPGVDIALSIDCVGLRNMNVLGVGKKMCSIKLVNGVFRHRFQQFVSSELETRVMWNLRGQGKTMGQIGTILHMNKSTVCRRLQGLPACTHVQMSKDSLSRYLESPTLFSGAASADSDDWP